jgi:thioredoxin reductase (NADPH)
LSADVRNIDYPERMTSQTPAQEVPLAAVTLNERVFPTLTDAQLQRIATHGQRRAMAQGETLVETGARNVRFFAVVSGAIQATRPSADGETVIVTLRAGQFSGEGTMLTGRPAITRLRVSEPGEAIELDREQLLTLIQTDAEISGTLMRAFILRRAELIHRHLGDVLVIGSVHCGGTLRVKEFLTRNGHPFTYVDLDRDPQAQELLDRFEVREGDVPVLICRGQLVLRNPSNQEIADESGLSLETVKKHLHSIFRKLQVPSRSRLMALMR